MITLNPFELTPTTLATIVANLSHILDGGCDDPKFTRMNMRLAYQLLVARVGFPGAEELLQAASANPEEVFA